MSDNIALVIFDLDGTLLDPDREAPIRPIVVEAVQRLLSRGVAATLATGRTWEYAGHRARELGIKYPMVTGQGASLVESDSGKIIREITLPTEIARRVSQRAPHDDQVMSLYFRDPRGKLHITVNRMDEEPAYYHHLLGPETEVISDFGPFLEEGWQLLKFVAFTRSLEDVAAWQEWVGPQAHMGRTHSHLIEGTAAGINKGAGVRALLELVKVPARQVLAIGDQENDISMFREVGLPVAMGHAPDNVKALAQWVAPSFEEDGVAAAIDHFFPS